MPAPRSAWLPTLLAGTLVVGALPRRPRHATRGRLASDQPTAFSPLAGGSRPDPGPALLVRLGRPPGRGGGGSRASADNRAIWLGLLAPAALLQPETWTLALRFLAVRAFTPVGAALAIVGLAVGRGAGPWRAWGLMSLATLAMLAPKLHHEYYFLILAPAAAAGVGLALDRLAAGRSWACSPGRRGLADHARPVAGPVDLADAARVGPAWKRPRGPWRR